MEAAALFRRASRRGKPLAATASRWALMSAGALAAFVVALWGALSFVHSRRPLASFEGAIALAAVLAAALVLFLLRAEEARLARELRIARTGSAALRAMVAGRRVELPLLARPFSTRLGLAAVLLADGDRSAAGDALAASAGAMRGGRLDRLRGIVMADLARAAGDPAGLGRCIASLRARAPIGNREADLYALHVWVKAILQAGDADAAIEAIEGLAASHDDAERIYLVWLRAWFAPDGEDAGLTEGELRLAALQARAQGAEKLLARLEDLQRGVGPRPTIARAGPEE